MAQSHSEVQESTTAGHQSIEEVEADITAADMWDDVEAPEEIYEGPGAFTASELADARNIDPEAVRKRARRQVRKGKWIEVKVRSDLLSHPIVLAWVKREVYEKWMNQHGTIT